MVALHSWVFMRMLNFPTPQYFTRQCARFHRMQVFSKCSYKVLSLQDVNFVPSWSIIACLMMRFLVGNERKHTLVNNGRGASNFALFVRQRNHQSRRPMMDLPRLLVAWNLCLRLRLRPRSFCRQRREPAPLLHLPATNLPFDP